MKKKLLKFLLLGSSVFILITLISNINTPKAHAATCASDEHPDSSLCGGCCKTGQTCTAGTGGVYKCVVDGGCTMGFTCFSPNSCVGANPNVDGTGTCTTPGGCAMGSTCLSPPPSGGGGTPSCSFSPSGPIAAGTNSIATFSNNGNVYDVMTPETGFTYIRTVSSDGINSMSNEYRFDTPNTTWTIQRHLPYDVNAPVVATCSISTQGNTPTATSTQTPSSTPTTTPLPSTCNPDKTGDSIGKIDDLDFDWWKNEFLGVSTYANKLSDCLQDNVIDIFDFNKMRDMRWFSGVSAPTGTAATSAPTCPAYGSNDKKICHNNSLSHSYSDGTCGTTTVGIECPGGCTEGSSSCNANPECPAAGTVLSHSCEGNNLAETYSTGGYVLALGMCGTLGRVTACPNGCSSNNGACNPSPPPTDTTERLACVPFNEWCGTDQFSCNFEPLRGTSDCIATITSFYQNCEQMSPLPTSFIQGLCAAR